MNPSKNIKKIIGNIPFQTSESKDKEVLDDVIKTLDESRKNQSAVEESNLWRVIIHNKTTKLGTAAVALIVLLYIFVGNSGTKVWAFEQSIEAFKNYNAVYMEGVLPDGNFECWVSSDDAGIQSRDFVVKTSNGIISWVKDGSTFIYVPQENTVYYENAITSGFSKWLGSELLEILASMKSTKVLYGKDPDTGRERVTVMSSLFDVTGPKSFVIEFDSETKLAVSMKQWDNMDRSGPPNFYASKIVFYKEAVDSFFEVSIPGNPNYVEKPLTIPDENIGLLSNPNHGISTGGLSEQQACEKILKAMYEAVMAGDIAKIKQLCPVSANMGDDFLREFAIREGKKDQMEELVSIGEISKRGQTKLGSIVSVPVVYKRKDGIKIKDQMIIQFRNFSDKPSCVVHGPYGISQQVD